MGYINSCIPIGSPDLYLFWKSSLSIILATVNFAIKDKVSFIVNGSSHAELKHILVFSGSNILNTCSLYVSAFANTCSFISGFLVSDLPVGSPIIPVKSPIKNVTLCPSS